jgi:hypothetical protein
MNGRSRSVLTRRTRSELSCSDHLNDEQLYAIDAMRDAFRSALSREDYARLLMLHGIEKLLRDTANDANREMARVRWDITAELREKTGKAPQMATVERIARSDGRTCSKARKSNPAPGYPEHC